MHPMLKRGFFVLAGLYMLIFFAQALIGRSLDGLKRQKADDAAVAAKDRGEARAPTARVQKPAAFDEKEHYEQAKKNLDHEALAKQGIYITPRHYGPTTTEDWEKYIEQNIVKPEQYNSLESRKILSTVATDEKQYEESMVHVQEQVDWVKAKLAKEPFNKKYQRRLQDLYRLQAMSRVLKDRVVTGDNAAASADN